MLDALLHQNSYKEKRLFSSRYGIGMTAYFVFHLSTVSTLTKNYYAQHSF